MRLYVNFWRSYADFKGRTPVRDFWISLLVHFIVVLFMQMLVLVLLILLTEMNAHEVLIVLSIQNFAVALCSICPCLAITARRLRDAGYSLHSMFWLLLPGIGYIAILARLCDRSLTSVTEE